MLNIKIININIDDFIINKDTLELLNPFIKRYQGNLKKQFQENYI